MSIKEYKSKKDYYFSNVRKEILDLIPAKNSNANMLEIGAGSGDTLLYAKQNAYAKYISGIELCKIDESHQESEEFSNFIIGDIENIVLPFENKTFDVIICGDVLEHLVNPYAVVEKLKKLLKDDGVIIVSLPNIRQIYILKDIVFKGKDISFVVIFNIKIVDNG